MRPTSWLLALLVLATLSPLLAQAQPAPPADPSTSPINDPLTIAAERYRPGRIAWQPCPENAAVECGTLTVPVDYAQPQGETFEMAIARTRASDPSRRIGVLFTNPGGPGISGVDFIIGAVANAPFFAPFRERFDIVSFDPRGVGRSRPVQCVPGSIEIPDGASDEQLAAAFDAFSRSYAEGCMRLDGPFVTTLSTNNVARDMDVLRRALGERTVIYAAGSYGTQLGAVYASLFPHRLRAIALDAGIAPTFRDFYVEDTADQMAGFEKELQRVAVLCSRDAACRLREQGVVAAFDELRAKLDAVPVTTPSGVTLTGRSLVSAAYTLLYREPLAPLLVDMVANGLDGDYTLLAQILPAVDAGVEVGAIYAIRCNDYGSRRAAADYLPVDEVEGARNPRFFGRFYLAYRLATCAQWPAADPPIIRNLQHKLDVPILLIMNDFDPATPPAWMRSLAFALGMEATVVRYQGGGHTFPKNNTCMSAIFADYLFELKLPPEGTTCPGQPIAFAPRAQASSLRMADDQGDALWQFVEPLVLPKERSPMVGR